MLIIDQETGVSRVHEQDEVPVSADLPAAIYRDNLNILRMDVSCYILQNGVRVIGRTSATDVLTGIKGGGALERMVPFRIPEVEGLEKAVKSLPTDLFIDICQGFVSALEQHFRVDSPYPRMTQRQQQMAIAASMFLSVCANGRKHFLMNFGSSSVV